MQYKVAALALAALASAQMDMPMEGGSNMPMPADAPAPPMAMPPATGSSSSPEMAPAAGAGAGGMPAAMGAGMGMGHGNPMMGGMPQFDNSTLSGQCREIAALTGFTKFAQNDTQVQMAAQVIPLSPEQVTELKANASMAAQQLQELTANATLAETCTQVNEVTGTCMRFAGLMRLEELAGNDTELSALQAKRNLTDDQVSKLKAFAKMEEENVDMMNNNVTLVTMCMALKQNMQSGMNMADAAIKAGSSSVPMNAEVTNESSNMNMSDPSMAGMDMSKPMPGMDMPKGSAKAEKGKDGKSSASSVAVSSFLAVAAVGLSLVVLA